MLIVCSLSTPIDKAMGIFTTVGVLFSIMTIATLTYVSLFIAQDTWYAEEKVWVPEVES